MFFAVERPRLFAAIISKLLEAMVKKTKAMVLFVIFTSLVVGAWAQQKGPLKFAQTIPLPDLHDCRKSVVRHGRREFESTGL